MLNSNPIISRAGTFWLEIQTNSSNSNTNFEIKEMGDITYDFDLVASDTQQTYVGGIPGALTVKIWDKLSNTGSAFDVLEAELGTYSLVDYQQTPIADVTMYWLAAGETNADNAYTFPFSLRFGDIALDERSHDTTLKLAPRRLTQNVATWELQYGTNGFPDQVEFVYNQGAFNVVAYNCYATGDVITNVLEGLDKDAQIIFETSKIAQLNTGANIFAFPTRAQLVEQSGYVNPSFPEAGLVAPVFFVGQGDPVNNPVWVVGQSNIVYDKVATFAGMEGAVFGSAFNVSFYVHRSTNIYNVELSNVELEELRFVTNPRNIKSVGINYTNSNLLLQEAAISNFNADNVTTYPDLRGINDFGAVYTAWEGQSDDLGLNYRGFQPQFQLSFIRPAIEPMVANAIFYLETIYNAFYLQPLADKAFREYAAPLGISLANTASYKIQFDLLGADKVRPYEVIKFDSTVPLRYQGKHFRPTSLSYDLKADKVKVTAYQIDSFPIPTPPDPPDPPQEFCYDTLTLYDFYQDPIRYSLAASNTGNLFAAGESFDYLVDYDVTTNTEIQNIALPSNFYATYLYYDNKDKYIYVMSNQEKHIRIINAANSSEQTVINTWDNNQDLFTCFIDDKTRRRLYIGLDTPTANPPVLTINLDNRSLTSNIDYRTNTSRQGTPEGLSIDEVRNIMVAADDGSSLGRGIYMLNIEDNTTQKINVPSTSQNRFVHSLYSPNTNAFYVFADGADIRVHSIESPSANIALVGSVPVMDYPQTALTNPIDGKIYFYTFPSDGVYAANSINVPLSNTYNIAVLDPMTNQFTLYFGLDDNGGSIDGEGFQMTVDSDSGKMYYGLPYFDTPSIAKICMEDNF